MFMNISVEYPALGTHQATFTRLDVCPRPDHVVEVNLTGDELTALPSVTHKPDFYCYGVRHRPVDSCIESKTFKLLIGSFHEQAAFVETLANDVATLVHAAAGDGTEVTMSQRVLVGVSITARAAILGPIGN